MTVFVVPKKLSYRIGVTTFKCFIRANYRAIPILRFFLVSSYGRSDKSAKSFISMLLNFVVASYYYSLLEETWGRPLVTSIILILLLLRRTLMNLSWGWVKMPLFYSKWSMIFEGVDSLFGIGEGGQEMAYYLRVYGLVVCR